MRKGFVHYIVCMHIVSVHCGRGVGSSSGGKEGRGWRRKRKRKEKKKESIELEKLRNVEESELYWRRQVERERERFVHCVQIVRVRGGGVLGISLGWRTVGKAGVP